MPARKASSSPSSVASLALSDRAHEMPDQWNACASFSMSGQYIMCERSDMSDECSRS